jgi:hypothetical protein
MELCTGFSMFEGVCAKMGFSQWGDFRKCRQALVFRMKLRVGDFSVVLEKWVFEMMKDEG